MSITEAATDERSEQSPETEQVLVGQTESRRFPDESFGDKHLEPEEFEQLLGGKLSGEQLVAVLVHLEECSDCQRKTPPIDNKSFLKAVFGGEDFLTLKNSDYTE